MLPLAATAAKQSVCVAISEYANNQRHTSGKSTIEKIVLESYASSPYQVVFKILPQKRALRAVKNGHCDAIAGALYDESRTKDYQFSTQSITDLELAFFKRKVDTIEWQTLDDLKPYVIGTLDSVAYPTEFKHAEFLQKSPISADSTPTQYFTRLANGRIDLLLLPKLQGSYIIANLLTEPLANLIEPLEPPLSRLSTHLMFSRVSDQVDDKMKAFDKGICELKDSGRLEAILMEHYQSLLDKSQS